MEHPNRANPNRASQGWQAVKAMVVPWYHLPWVQAPLWSMVYIGRYVWRNVFALAALAAGLAFIVYVDQTREILANLVADTRSLGGLDAPQNLHAGFFVAALAVWALSTWYAMRLLSSSRFPADPPVHPQARACAHWVNEEVPRLAPLAAVSTVACTASIYLAQDPTARWMPLLAAGIVPLTWSVASIGDRVLRRLVARLHERPHPVLFLPTLAIALAAAGASAWHLPPLPANGALPAQHWAALFLAAGTLALAWPCWLGRRSKSAARQRACRRIADYAMLFLAAVFFAFALPGAAAERGFRIALIILVLAAMGLWATSRRRDLLGIEADPGTPSHPARRLAGPFDISLPTLIGIGVTLLALVAFAVGFARAPIALGNWMGTLAIVFVGLALWSFFGAMWVYLPKVAGWPALGAVPLLWLALFGASPDHALRDTGYERFSPPRPRLDEHFAEWRRQLPPGGEPPVFFVAASGGGLRAAFWTANMLAAADDATCGEFGRHVYAYSGVSGGSLGIAAYLAQRQVWEEKKNIGPDPCVRGRKDEITRLLGRDFLAPVAGSIMFAELASRFVHAPLDNERGATLARSWSRAWDEELGPLAAGRFDGAFVDILAAFAEDGRAGPAVYLNATGADSGRRVIASNVANLRGGLPGTVDLLREERHSALKTAGLPLREAVLNSARFTYVSPAGAVYGCYGKPIEGRCPPGQERIWERLVDGGYFENSGVATLSDVMHSLGKELAKQKVFVILIDNGSDPVLACRPNAAQSRAERRAEEQPDAVPPLSGVTAPIEAFLRVREARAQLEVRRLRSSFSCGENGQLIDWNLFGDEETRREAREAQQQPALGWFLSTRSAKWMLERVEEVARQFPFRLAACHDARSSPPARGLLGARDFPAKHCSAS